MQLLRHFGTYTSRGAWLIVGISAALLALYALAGFLWVPRLIQASVLETFQRDYQRKAELARPRFNPFTFELEARSFAVPDRDGARMLGFERLYVDFELSSLFRLAWTFDQISIERPYLRLLQRADGSLNLADLRKTYAPERDEGDSGVPALAIGTLSVTGGEVDVLDRMRAEPFATTLRPVGFELTHFRSSGDGNAFSFSAGSDRIGRLSVEGTLGLGPFNSKGLIALSNLPAQTVTEYLGDLVPVSLQAGRIDLQIGYDFSLAGEPIKLVLELPTAGARDLVTRARGYDVDWRIPILNLRDARVDVAARKLRIGVIELRDVAAPVWMDDQGFHAPGAVPRSEPGSAAPEAAPAADTSTADAPVAGAPTTGERAWQIEIAQVDVANAAFALEDRRVKPKAALAIVAQELQVRDFTMPQRQPLSIAATFTSEAGGGLSLQGTLDLDPLALTADVATTALDLRAAQPYLDSGTDLKLQSGKLTSQGRLSYAATGSPMLRYAGNLSVAGLRTQDGTLREDFVNWSALELRRLEYTHEPARLEIREIVARQPYLRLILAATGVTNVLSVLDPEAAARKAAEIAAERAGQEAKKPSRKRRLREGKVSISAAPAAPLKPRLPAKIDMIRIENGNLNFSDFTLKPAFRIAVERLAGTITGMTSVAGDRARLELAGEVDRYAPARISGELNLLAAKAFMDIAADFRNIELTSFNPYSGKFAGYRIDKGKLSIETSYRVENRRLDAGHRFTLDQLQLGERVESPDAVSLPLRLAVALLKDRNGVIDIDLPVTGSLDDPKFRLGPIIWKAFLNLLAKIVTSPFALLGNLFGGGADLSEVPFAPGVPALDAAATEKLAALRKALVERPGLNVDVPSTADPEADRNALVEQRWIGLLAGTGGAAGPAADAQVGALQSDRTAYRHRLVRLYRERFGSKPEIPKPSEPADHAAQTDPVEYEIGQLEAKLRATFVIEEAEIAALAQARAESVRDALLADGAVDSARVFLIRGEPMMAADGLVRMKLSLK